MKLFKLFSRVSESKCNKKIENCISRDGLFIKVISKIRTIQKMEPKILIELFTPEKGDSKGYKSLYFLSSELFDLKLSCPNYLKKFIIQENETFSEKEFFDWIMEFGQRVAAYELQLGINNREINQIKYVNEFLTLSNLDLIFLKNEFNDKIFNQFLFKRLTINRLKIIFNDDDFHVCSNYYRIDNNSNIENRYLELFYHGFNKLKKDFIRWYVPNYDLKFFYVFLDSVSQEIAASLIKQKTVFELCRIMLELDEVYRLKFFKLISNDLKEKIIILTSDNKVIFKDAKDLSKFIKEIQKEYYSGKFTLSNFDF